MCYANGDGRGISASAAKITVIAMVSDEEPSEIIIARRL